MIVEGTDSDYNIGDHVIIRWDGDIYPGEITLVCERGALGNYMTRSSIA